MRSKTPWHGARRRFSARAQSTRSISTNKRAMDDSLAETWAINNRVNLYLLDAIADDALGAALPKSRSVHDLFAHIHNVRLMWLKPAAPELLDGLEKLETKT